MTQKFAEAVKWYKLAADQGYAGAQYNLGFCYAYGKGVGKNRTEGIRLLRQAHANGSSSAAQELKKLGVKP